MSEIFVPPIMPMSEAECLAIEQAYRHGTRSWESLFAALQTIPRLLTENKRLREQLMNYTAPYPPVPDDEDGSTW